MVSEQIKLFVPCLLCRRASKREGKVQVYYGRIGPDIQRTVWLLNAPHGSALLNSLLQTPKSFTNVRICDYILLAHKLIRFKFSHHLFIGSIWWQHNLIRIDAMSSKAIKMFVIDYDLIIDTIFRTRLLFNLF